jgi:FkbM family methyltransferase
MAINIIKRISSYVTGKKRFQEIFEKLNLFSLYGMNIGGGVDPTNSGEKSVINLINEHFKRIKFLTIFDVGANVGQYTLLLKKTFGNKVIIHSFEPSRKTFDKLKINVKNKTRIHIHNFGLGISNTNTILYSDSDESGLASIFKRRLDHFKIEMNQNEEIKIKTLDSFCTDKNIEHIHFLKLDVEGSELKVFKGASKMLNSGGINFIQFEFGGCNIDSKTYFQDFYYLLKDNYKIFRIVKDGLFQINTYKEMYEVFLTTNYFAKRNNL